MIDAFIIGTQRSGTTSLAMALNNHPSICLAGGKEAHLFDNAQVQRYGVNSESLAASFPNFSTGQIKLDATPSYLYLPGCLEAIHRHNAKAKVIVILRDPGQRAVSHWHHSRWLKRECLPAFWAVVAERRRIRGIRNPLDLDSAARLFSYVDRGRYLSQLETLLHLWPEALVLPFPRLVNEAGAVFTELQEYLGLEVLDLEPHFRRMNQHEGRKPHSFTAWLVRLLLYRDQSAALGMMKWSPKTLRETK